MAPWQSALPPGTSGTEGQFLQPALHDFMHILGSKCNVLVGPEIRYHRDSIWQDEEEDTSWMSAYTTPAAWFLVHRSRVVGMVMTAFVDFICSFTVLHLADLHPPPRSGCTCYEVLSNEMLTVGRWLQPVRGGAVWENSHRTVTYEGHGRVRELHRQITSPEAKSLRPCPLFSNLECAVLSLH